MITEIGGVYVDLDSLAEAKLKYPMKYRILIREISKNNPSRNIAIC